MKPNAIIVLDLENTQTHNCLNYILNIFKRKFEIIKILGFGNIFYPKKYVNKFITKDFLINLYKQKKEYFKKRLIPLLKCLFPINNIDCVFMDNKIGENAADNNIINYIETDILQNKQKYSNTTIILFSQDGDFKNILDELTQNDISNFVIGSPNDNCKSWKNLGKYRFNFQFNNFIQDKTSYTIKFLNSIDILISLEKKFKLSKNNINNKNDIQINKNNLSIKNNNNNSSNENSLFNINLEKLTNLIKIENNNKNEINELIQLFLAENKNLRIKQIITKLLQIISNFKKIIFSEFKTNKPKRLKGLLNIFNSYEKGFKNEFNIKLKQEQINKIRELLIKIFINEKYFLRIENNKIIYE